MNNLELILNVNLKSYSDFSFKHLSIERISQQHDLYKTSTVSATDNNNSAIISIDFFGKSIYKTHFFKMGTHVCSLYYLFQGPRGPKGLPVSVPHDIFVSLYTQSILNHTKYIFSFQGEPGPKGEKVRFTFRFIITF